MPQSHDPASHDPAYNRDQDLEPGRPPRPATPSRGSASAKTLTDPATGKPRSDSHAPNQAKADQIDGAKGPK